MTTPEPPVPQIRIGQILLERATFSHRDDYLNFPPSTPVAIADVQLSVQAGITEDRAHAIVRLQAYTGTDAAVTPGTDAVVTPPAPPLYRFDVVIVVLVDIDPPTAGDRFDRFITGAAAGFGMPFLREVVANLTSRGRFGPMWLQPVNVRALVEQLPPTREPAPVGSASAPPPKRPAPEKRSTKRKARGQSSPS